MTQIKILLLIGLFLFVWGYFELQAIDKQKVESVFQTIPNFPDFIELEKDLVIEGKNGQIFLILKGTKIYYREEERNDRLHYDEQIYTFVDNWQWAIIGLGVIVALMARRRLR